MIFACAAERRTALAPAVATLMRLGYKVELVYGLKAQPAALERLAFDRRGTALYMLCGGPETTDDLLADMHDAVSDQGVPPERVWSGEVDWDEPLTILDAVAQRLGGVDRTARKTTVVGPPPPPPKQAPIPSVGTAVVPQPDDSDVLDGAALGLGWRRFSGPRVWYAVAGVAAVLGLVSLAAMSGDGDEDEAKGNAVADASTVEEESKEPEPEPEPEPEATPAEPEPEPGPEIAIDEAGEGGEAADADVPRPDPAADPPVEDAEEADADGEAGEDDEGEDDEGGTVGTVLSEQERRAEQDVIYEALSDQQIRSIDILLVAPLAVEVKKFRRRTRTKILKFTFDSATKYCEELDVSGVERWRLPTIGELVSLSKVGWLDKTQYWSQTKADTFGKARLVWNNRSGRMGPVPQRWKGGRLVCVRYTRPEVEGEPDISAP